MTMNLSSPSQPPNSEKVQPEPALNKRRISANVALLVIATLTALLIAEISVRFYLSSKRNDLDSLRNYHQSRLEPRHDESLMLADFVEIWNNDYRVYRLRPNLRGQFINHPLNINEHGYRGPGLSIEKPENSFRIIGIGDSVMFGWGVSFDQTYLSLLIEFLNSRRPESSNTVYEMANLATPGYNSIMEMELLREAGLPLKPDLVVLGFVENDATIPNFIRRRENYWAVNRLFLIELIVANFQTNRNVNVVDGSPLSPPGLEHAFNPEKVQWELEDNNWKVKWMKVPPEYEYLHGWDKVEKAFDKMKQMGNENGFGVVMLTDYFLLDDYIAGKTDVPDRDVARGLAIGKQYDFHIADSLDMIARFVEESGRPAKDVLWLTEQDSHPNLSRQYLLAATIYKTLILDNLIPDAEYRFNTLSADMDWWFQQATNSMQ